MYGKVLDELTQSLNFTLELVSEVYEYGMWNKENQTWSGVMGEIVSGRADFAIVDMSMTSLRVRYVDFTLPLIISKNSLFVKEPGICGVKWFGYLQVYIDKIKNITKNCVIFSIIATLEIIIIHIHYFLFQNNFLYSIDRLLLFYMLWDLCDEQIKRIKIFSVNNACRLT